jgi:hypothetical protein
MKNVYLARSLDFVVDLNVKAKLEPYSKHFIFLVTYEWAPFVPGRPFQPSLIFPRMARSGHLKGALLGYAPAFLANIK